jgi:hypothetical protein
MAGAILESKMGAGLFSLQIEGDYVKKGWKDLFEYDLSYFEIPVLLRLNLPLPIITPFAMAGPSIAFLTGATAAGVDAKSSFNGTDFGLIFGAGVEIAMGPVAALVAQFRYEMGLTDVTKSAVDAKNKGVQITGGLLFGF